jgi:hypothetical protein
MEEFSIKNIGDYFKENLNYFGLFHGRVKPKFSIKSSRAPNFQRQVFRSLICEIRTHSDNPTQELTVFPIQHC